MMKNSNGQSSFEFLLSLPLWSLIALSSTFIVAKLVLNNLVWMDAVSLNRSFLYDEHRAQCLPHSFWTLLPTHTTLHCKTASLSYTSSYDSLPIVESAFQTRAR